MNIFVVDECPEKSAKSLLDKHIVKMPLESLQMMSTNAFYCGVSNYPYKPVMLNHPCTIWARESKQNWLWLWRHAKSLCKEYTSRYGRTHKCETKMEEYNSTWIEVMKELPSNGLTPFAIAISDNMLCRKIDGFDELSTVDKYRQYYIHDKRRIAFWKQNKPDWFVTKKMEMNKND